MLNALNEEEEEDEVPFIPLKYFSSLWLPRMSANISTVFPRPISSHNKPLYEYPIIAHNDNKVGGKDMNYYPVTYGGLFNLNSPASAK